MNTNSQVFALVVGVALSVVGCGGDSKSAGGEKKAEPAKAAEADKKEPPKAEPPKAEPPKLVDKDLSPAGEKWAGWTAKGPEDATVMEDLGGARIATPKVRGPGSFDVAFRQERVNFADRKKGIQEGAEMAKSTVTFSVDTPDALEWSSTIGSSTMYQFVIVRKVGDVEVTCYTVSPRESADEIAVLKQSCESLAKK